MENLHTYIYEIKKGTKLAALLTFDVKDLDSAKEKVEKAGLSYTVQKYEDMLEKPAEEKLKFSKINLFFGEKSSINVIKTFIEKPLHQLCPKEDFILGIILGYSREKQCERYLSKLIFSQSENCHNG